jgi:hypothetical protein
MPLAVRVTVMAPLALPPKALGITDVTFHDLKVEVIALENVNVEDPSPHLTPTQ